MRIDTVVLVSALILSFNLRAEDELPRLKVLRESWQRARSVALKPIDEKYIAVLAKLEKECAKSGNQKGAEEVRQEIEKLVPPADPVKVPPSLPKTDRQLEKFLVGTHWKFKDNRVVTFNADRTIDKSWGILHPQWRVLEMEVYFEEKVLSFDKTFSLATAVKGEGDLGADPGIKIK